MSQTFNSRKKTKKPWLDSIYLQRKNRTFELGKRSIDELIKQGIKISYRKIAELSKKLILRIKVFILIPLKVILNFITIIKKMLKLKL